MVAHICTPSIWQKDENFKVIFSYIENLGVLGKLGLHRTLSLRIEEEEDGEDEKREEGEEEETIAVLTITAYYKQNTSTLPIKDSFHYSFHVGLLNQINENTSFF